MLDNKTNIPICHHCKSDYAYKMRDTLLYGVVPICDYCIMIGALLHRPVKQDANVQDEITKISKYADVFQL